jgi:MOSC domain-containing protein YiiM
MRPGRLEWIGVRPARRISAEPRASANLTAGHGVDGDRYNTNRDGPRQVTLIAAEDTAAIAAFLGLPEVAPELLRRNLVTRGINLLALKDRRFRVGAALLEGSGECAPCSRMEETFGPEATTPCADTAESPPG